jgi:hypothetical protein
MKTVLIRTFVVALALTGMTATAVTTQNGRHNLSTVNSMAGPMPSCPWNDPNACGMGGSSGN